MFVSPPAEDPLYAQKLKFIALFSVLSGALISVYGVYVPFLLAGGAITTIGAGLLYTLDVGSPASHWIGYQALAGIGIGLSIQVPIIANQSFVKVSEISSITAVTLCEYLTLFKLSLVKSSMTNTLSSLPNDRRRHLCRSGSSSLHQPTAREGPGPRPRRQPRPRRINGCKRVANGIFSRTASWHCACLHGRTEAGVRVGNRILRSDPAHCGIREVAEC